jgi:hypothetical protein
MPFPNLVKSVAGVAQPGDFASSNPRASLDAGMGQFVADAAGCIVAHFAWIGAGGNTLTSVGTAAVQPDAFIHREMNALIATYLQEGTMTILSGLPVTGMISGDYWALDAGGIAAVPRKSTVWARLTDGAVGISATGAGADLPGGAVAWVKTNWLTTSVIAQANDLVKISSYPPV